MGKDVRDRWVTAGHCRTRAVDLQVLYVLQVVFLSQIWTMRKTVKLNYYRPPAVV